MNTKNRGWEEGDGDQKPRDTADVIKNVRGEQHKIKIEDLGQITCQPPQPSLSKAGSAEYD